MDLSKLPASLIAQLTAGVENFILNNRKKYFPRAASLEPAQLVPLEPYFPASILRDTRFLVLEDSRIDDPPFYSMAKMMGIRNLPSFSDVAAVTFVDVVVSHEEWTESLLFHELVHVVQYAQLGNKEFASRYVNGYIKGGSYEEILLEKNATELEERFSRKNGVFLVADEVRSWIEMGRF
jgi:hypothetical protein